MRWSRYLYEFYCRYSARYPSSRLPGKPLADIGGKPMIQHVYERALQSGAAEVIIATDDQRIADEVERFGGRSMLTSSEHQSGTERLAEVVEQLALSEDQVVVNVQGDEPLFRLKLSGKWLITWRINVLHRWRH